MPAKGTSWRPDEGEPAGVPVQVEVLDLRRRAPTVRVAAHEQDRDDEQRREHEPRNAGGTGRFQPPAGRLQRVIGVASYWIAVATRRRSSGEMRWSWSSTPASSCTQRTVPLKWLFSLV